MQSDLTPSNSGTWEEHPDGGQVWRLRVHSERARWIVLGFGTFRVDPGAELSIYDPERTTELGPFGREHVRRHGQLWLPPIESDTLVVELRWPEQLRAVVPDVQIGTVVHGYKDAWGGDLEVPTDPTPDAGSPAGSGACNVDVRCPAGEDHEEQSRGVVQLLSGGFAFCTGTLVNTTANDCRPYVLTAAHCVDSLAEALSTTFRFEYERPLCESGVAPWDLFVTGSTLLATYSASDFTLLAIDHDLPEEVDPFFNGWSRSSQPALESWGIHHPSGDVKKISYNPNPVVHGRINGWGVDHWRVNYWGFGTTEAGSPGSPLVDQNGRIVGQLHGGLATCENSSWDEYGKLSVSWIGGGTPESRLSDWLDPEGTGDVTLDGIPIDACEQPSPAPCIDGYRVMEVEGDGDGRPDPGEIFDLEVERCDDDPTETELEIASSSVTRERRGSRRSEGPRPRFTLRVDEDHPCGEPIALRLRTSEADILGEAVDFEIPTGDATVVELFRDGIDTGPAAWKSLSSGDGWQRQADTGPDGRGAWRVANTENALESFLVLKLPAPIPPRASLRFVHRHDTENVRDGGVLEYSRDGGATWNDAGHLILEGGYNSGIGSEEYSPLAGRSAWAGDSGGWQGVEVDLGSLRGTDLSLRWRFASDGSIGDDGWLLDDVVVDSTSYACHIRSNRGGPGPSRGGAARRARSGL